MEALPVLKKLQSKPFNPSTVGTSPKRLNPKLVTTETVNKKNPPKDLY